MDLGAILVKRVPRGSLHPRRVGWASTSTRTTKTPSEVVHLLHLLLRKIPMMMRKMKRVTIQLTGDGNDEYAD